MKVYSCFGLMLLIFISASCVGDSTNGIVSEYDISDINSPHSSSCDSAKWWARDLETVKLPPYNDASHGTSFKGFQAQELLRVLDKIVETEKKEIGLLGEWHLRGLHFDCIIDGKPSSGWFMITDSEMVEVELFLSSGDGVLSENGIILSGVSLAIGNYIHDICKTVGCNLSNITNIEVSWRAGLGGTFYKGTVYLNDDGSVRDRLYGSL